MEGLGEVKALYNTQNSKEWGEKNRKRARVLKRMEASAIVTVQTPDCHLCNLDGEGTPRE